MEATSIWKVATVLLLSITKLRALTLPQSYDSTVRPNQGSVADVVNVSVELLAIRDLNEARSQMTVDITLHSSWVDARLVEAVNRDTLIVNQLPNIWIPDVQIANAADPPTAKDANQYLQINKDGVVTLSQKHTKTITCQVSLAKYPFDRQLCKLQINSFGYSAVHLKLFWHGTVSDNVPTYHTMYSFSHAEQSSNNIKTSTGADYSNLFLEIGIKRCPLQVIFRAMLPPLLLLILSYYLTFCHCPIFPIKSATSNGHHVEAAVIAQSSQSVPALTAIPDFNLLLIALNGMIFLLTVLISQINFIASPPSSALSGLDVWLNFVSAIQFVTLWHSVQLFFNSSYRRINTKNDSGSCYMNNVNSSLKIGIPPTVVVFIIVFCGVYLS